MTSSRPLRIYVVTGETSGDVLGAGIMGDLASEGVAFEIGGLAGEKMKELGAQSLFDISQLSIMGITAIIANIPRIYKLVHRVVADAIEFKPDIVVLIDSPDFNAAVAKRIKKKNPNIPIVKYICPSVWAWRQGRAKKMKAYIDHILAILPFEPKLLVELDGPQATYVGHPLAKLLDQIPKSMRQKPNHPVKLLILPGSRKGEIVRLMPVIRASVELLESRGVEFSMVLPAVDHLEHLIKEYVSDWHQKPEVVVGKNAKRIAFEEADVALACSGTVLLELGIYAIPTISIYKLDKAGFIVRRMVKAWTGCLPNLITDKVIIPERFEEYANPQAIARELQELCIAGPTREAQLAGFKQLRQILVSEGKGHQTAASKILELAGR